LLTRIPVAKKLIDCYLDKNCEVIVMDQCPILKKEANCTYRIAERSKKICTTEGDTQNIHMTYIDFVSNHGEIC